MQNEENTNLLKSQGFKNVKTISPKKNIDFKEITLYKTGGTHGETEACSNLYFSKEAGDTMGVVFQTLNQKSVYIIENSVWTANIYKVLNKYQPEIVIMNTGDARFMFTPNSQIIMSRNNIMELAQFNPKIKIIAIHMETVNHYSISSEDIENITKENNIQDRVFAPKDGEILTF